jgi:transcriptional regulator with XRE-family HTH domain
MINPRQCRGARALLGITQQQLADRAGVSKRTVIEFEGGVRDPLVSTTRNLQLALEHEGIEFLFGNGGGSGVRFRDPEIEDQVVPRVVSRRQMLGGLGLLLGAPAATDIVAGSMSSARADVLPASDGPRTYTSVRMHRPDDVLKWGSDLQRSALDLWRAGRLDVPDDVANRATLTYLGPNGRQWVEWQGREVAGLLFNEKPRVHIPMAGQTDSSYGAWAEGRISACQLERIPHYHRCHAVVAGADGRRRVMSYTALHLPRDDGRVLSISARVAQPKLLPEPPATTSSPANADRERRTG